MPSDLEILNEATRLLEKGTSLALCTVIEKKGSGPRDVGAKMIVSEDGTTYGTIGGGNVERALIDECLKAIKEHKSRKVTFNLSKNQKDGTVGTGMICGGELTMLSRRNRTRPKTGDSRHGSCGIALSKASQHRRLQSSHC